MLRAGGWLLSPDMGRDHLDTRECLDFLAGLDPHPIHVAYFFDYDVTKILEDLGWYKLNRLIDRESRMPRERKGQPFPVDVFQGEFQIEYMPRKFFKVRKRVRQEIIGVDENGEEEHKNVYGKWITVNDVGSFFQCRFVQALEMWNIGTAEERALVAAGKEARNSHRSEDFERIRAYNALECRLLAELMEQFRDACIDVGYVPRQWQGPGQVAESMLHQNGIPKSADVPLLSNPANEGLLTFARNAFYGGRPEITAVGNIPYRVEQWDINSAYPWALMHVPCLLHGKWKHVKRLEHRGSKRNGSVGDIDIRPTAIYYGTFDWNKEGYPPVLYGLPVRGETGTISYPRAGRGWYWGFEILASVHQKFRAAEGYEYVARCSCVPFGWISKVYAVRKSMGKDARGIVLKLALNSLYGKMAQSIGSPKYANPIWASYITAFCRTQIQELLHSTHGNGAHKCGRGVWMIATDALFTSEELTIKESGSLGGFSKEEHPNGIFLVQPGLYFRSSVGKDGKTSKPKTRGVPQSLVIQHEQEFRENFRRMATAGNLEAGDVRMELRGFIGIRQAIHRHNLKILGQWVATTKTISFDWRNKRQNGFAHHGPQDEYITLGPKDGDPETETVPYNKDIGKLLAESRIDFEDQPDWADQISSMEEM
jgi:hypothetical protein